MADDIKEAILGLTGNYDPQRGNLPTRLAAAVVVGLGGSGIQTISRVRRAVRSARPDADAVDGITFLGIDAVNFGDQEPKIPPEATEGLPFLNITREAFNPRDIVANALSADPQLRAWWDARYVPPAGTITTGMKQQRMLGRLAFYQDRNNIHRRIGAAVTEASQIRAANVARNLLPIIGNSLDVYVVGSSCGGTGSSGFLDVTHAIWAACRAQGLIPKIRAFLFLPGAFHAALSSGIEGARTWDQVQANAFAFFKELDHFLRHGDQVAAQVCDTAIQPDPGIGRMDLLYQAYLIDSMVTGAGNIADIADLYDITAESIFQFLLSDLARPIVAANAANTEAVLVAADKYGRRRAYCGLGVSRIVFPGDTYRRFLEMRAADWFLRTAMLHEPNNLDEIVRKHPDVAAATIRVEALLSSVGAVTYDDAVDEFDGRAVEAPANLSAEPTMENAEKTIKRLEQLAPRVAENIAEVVRAAAGRIASEVDPHLVALAHDPGLGVVFADKALGRLLKAIREFIRATEADMNNGITTKKDSADKMQTARANLRKLEGRRFVRQGTRQAAGRALGQAIAGWAAGVKQEAVSAETLRFARRVEGQIVGAQQELIRARELLRRIAREAEVVWHRDDLLGKDAGAKTTTTLVPSDVSPEVEDSRVAKSVFKAVESALGDRLLEQPTEGGTSPGLRALTTRWLGEGGRRGYYSLGALDQDELRLSRDALLATIGQWLRNWVILDENDAPRLPADLPTAAGMEDGGLEKLDQNVKGLANLSQSVCWSVDPTRLHLGERTAKPAPSTVIAAHPSSQALVTANTQGLASTRVTKGVDPERIIALTVAWGVPAHALGPLPNWKVAYDAWMAKRKNAAAVSATEDAWPLHLRAEWDHSGLDDLVPEYFDRPEVTRVVAKALIVNSIIEAPDATQELQGLLPVLGRRDRPKVLLLKMEVLATGAFGFRGRVLNESNGEFAVDDEEIDFGTGWAGLVTAVGTRVAYQDSVNAILGRVTDVVTAPGLLKAVETYQERLDGVIKTTSPHDPDIRILQDLDDTLDDWAAELDRTIKLTQLAQP